VGRRFRLRELGPDERGDEQAITDAIMRRIAALLPPEMRGAYP
jgi:hypothetical protein